jgi:hypothetical protein
MSAYQKRIGAKAWLILVLVIFLTGVAYCQLDARKEVKIPDILGYHLLKCDFHTHTVFSDGNVWPIIRPEEAWLQGLDALAITDHIEYTPHKKDVVSTSSRSYEIALPTAKARNITLIRGAEITRDMPPGHLNAIFLKDVKPLDTETWRDAVKAAHDQGAFIFWNHPGWKGQQPDGVGKWYDEHTELLKNGWLQGIEVVNDRDYYPEAHRWCLEKNLTMLGDSDVHDPIDMSFDLARGQHRPMTLVLAKDNSEEAIKEALLARRTVVYWTNCLIGKAEYLRPIFDNSIRIKNPDLTLKGTERGYFQIRNSSDIDYELVLDKQIEDFWVPETITLYADRTVFFIVRSKSKEISGEKKLEPSYKVKNLKISPEDGLPVTLKFNITFVKEK